MPNSSLKDNNTLYQTATVAVSSKTQTSIIGTELKQAHLVFYTDAAHIHLVLLHEAGIL